MSLGIAFKGPEGIVLAADSRVTLNYVDATTECAEIDASDSRWDSLFADARSEDVFLAFATEARETDKSELWSLEDSGL